jgi:hypothetical protein
MESTPTARRNKSERPKVALSAKPPHLDVMAIVVDPNDPLLIYVGAHEAGIFKSADGGMTWKPLGNELMDLAAVAVNPRRFEDGRSYYMVLVRDNETALTVFS